MTTDATAATLPAEDHVPHVLPVGIYLAVFGTLLGLTAATVAASYVDLGSWNLVIALFIATCKALLVAGIFMHLLFDKKFNAIIFAFSVVFLAILISLTMSDTSFRGLSGSRTSNLKPADIEAPFSGTVQDLAIERQWGKTPAPEPANPKPQPTPLPAPALKTPPPPPSVGAPVR